jgi:hypothetical protein
MAHIRIGPFFIGVAASTAASMYLCVYMSNTKLKSFMLDQKADKEAIKRDYEAKMFQEMNGDRESGWAATKKINMNNYVRVVADVLDSGMRVLRDSFPFSK